MSTYGNAMVCMHIDTSSNFVGNTYATQTIVQSTTSKRPGRVPQMNARRARMLERPTHAMAPVVRSIQPRNLSLQHTHSKGQDGSRSVQDRKASRIMQTESAAKSQGTLKNDSIALCSQRSIPSTQSLAVLSDKERSRAMKNIDSQPTGQDVPRRGFVESRPERENNELAQAARRDHASRNDSPESKFYQEILSRDPLPYSQHFQDDNQAHYELYTVDREVAQLRTELSERSRVLCSEACQDLIDFVMRSHDPMIPSVHGHSLVAEDMLGRETSCCTIA